MGQVSLRTDDELIRRVKAAAAANGTSMNEFITAVLEASTNPDFAGDEAERTRERLRRAGLLAPLSGTGRRPAPGQLTAARAAAGKGTPLSTLVQADRD